MITSGFARRSRSRGHAEHVEVLAQRRKERALHPLELDAQHHHDVRAFDRFVDRRRARARRSRSMPGGISVGGPHDPHLGAQLGQQLHVRPQHAAVQQVADDGHLQPGDAASCARGS